MAANTVTIMTSIVALKPIYSALNSYIPSPVITVDQMLMNL